MDIYHTNKSIFLTFGCQNGLIKLLHHPNTNSIINLCNKPSSNSRISEYTFKVNGPASCISLFKTPNLFDHYPNHPIKYSNDNQIGLYIGTCIGYGLIFTDITQGFHNFEYINNHALYTTQSCDSILSNKTFNINGKQYLFIGTYSGKLLCYELYQSNNLTSNLLFEYQMDQQIMVCNHIYSLSKNISKHILSLNISEYIHSKQK